MLNTPTDVTGPRVDDLRSRDYMKYLVCLATVPGGTAEASRTFLKLFPNAFGRDFVKKELQLLTTDQGDGVRKALTQPATTLGSDWAAPLVGIQSLASGFLQIAHASSLLGRLPGIQRVPFNTKVPTQNQEANYGWVQEGFAKKISQMSFAAGVTLAPRKAAGIVVFTTEFVKVITPATEEALRNTLVNGLVSFTDKAILSTSAEVAETAPAGILAGVPAVTPGADFAASMQALIDAFFTARPGASQDTTLIAGPQKAAQIRALAGGGGVGFPIVVTDAAGTKVILVDPRGLVYADDGLIVDIATQAAIEMNDAPTSPPVAATVMTSLWQQNLVGFKVERFLNFAATAVGGSSVQWLA